MNEQTWRKSSYSGSGGGNCVETASTSSHILVRDTKNRDAGHLMFTADAWRQFTNHLK